MLHRCMSSDSVRSSGVPNYLKIFCKRNIRQIPFLTRGDVRLEFSMEASKSFVDVFLGQNLCRKLHFYHFKQKFAQNHDIIFTPAPSHLISKRHNSRPQLINVRSSYSSFKNNRIFFSKTSFFLSAQNNKNDI